MWGDRNHKSEHSDCFEPREGKIRNANGESSNLKTPKQGGGKNTESTGST